MGDVTALVFSSLIFLYLFLPASFLLYYSVRHPVYRNWILIITSMVFYAWGEPVWITLLIFSAAVDYVHGLIAQRYRGSWQAKAAVLSSLVVNLGLLGFFKYWSFLIDNLNWLLGSQIPSSHFSLPIGISFYTFQTISYVLDVYRGDVNAQPSFPKFLLFVSLFHQLVAGPIVRYKDIAREIDHRGHSLALFSAGVTRFCVGLGKKVLLANTAGEVADLLLKGNLTTLPVSGAWLGITMFAFQIYFDFSGYSDMAIGLGKMFGFNYKENFNYPYVSTSATEFWRRWHISLGSFFRDYLYIPLGGNRRSAIRNLFIVWSLTGLWHGASWNFVVWGLYYGVLIAVEKLFLARILARLPALAHRLYFVVITLVGWTFFYYTDLAQGGQVLGIMFGALPRPLTSPEVMLHFTNNAALLVVLIVASTPFIRSFDERSASWAALKGWTQWRTELTYPLVNLLNLAASTVLLVGKTYNPFLYFRF